MDRILPRIAELLPYGSVQVVNRQLLKADYCGGLLFWERLARHHPQIAVKAILGKLIGVEQPDALSLRYARSVVMFAGRAEPDLTAQLVKALAQFMPLSHLDVSRTLYLRPNELATIVLESEDSASFSLTPVARTIDVLLLKKILQERSAALPFHASWFRKIPAVERAKIFQEVGRSWRDAEGLLPVDVLALLPTKERIAEAERIADLPIVATRPQTQAAFAAYFPLAKMREITDRFLTRSEGESRAWGCAAILASLRFHHDQVSHVLAMIRKRKFEQDQVRLTILQNLAELPQGIWKAEHLI